MGLFGTYQITRGIGGRICRRNVVCAGRADRHVIVFVFDVPYFEAWINLARRTGLGKIVVVQACNRTRFGQTVNIAPGDLDAEARPPLLTDFWREGRATNGSELSKAPLLRLIVGRIGDECEHRSQQIRQRCPRSEEHTSELQSLMRISYAV